MNNKKYFCSCFENQTEFHPNQKVYSFFNFAKQAFKNWKRNLQK